MEICFFFVWSSGHHWDSSLFLGRKNIYLRWWWWYWSWWWWCDNECNGIFFLFRKLYKKLYLWVNWVCCWKTCVVFCSVMDMIFYANAFLSINKLFFFFFCIHYFCPLNSFYSNYYDELIYMLKYFINKNIYASQDKTN